MTATPALTPLPPGSTLGILGGGQLGRMLSQAASRLGFNVVILDPEDNSPAGRVSQGQIVAAYDNPTALGVLGQTCAAVTFEFENVPAASVARLVEGGAVVSPGPKALSGQDSLLSIVQMPAGVPVGTLAIGESGATNAALLAAAVLALSDPEIDEALTAYRNEQTAKVADYPKDE